MQGGFNNEVCSCNPPSRFRQNILLLTLNKWMNPYKRDFSSESYSVILSCDVLFIMLYQVVHSNGRPIPDVVGSIPAKVKKFFLCFVPSPISLLELTLSEKFMGSLTTLTYTAELVL